MPKEPVSPFDAKILRQIKLTILPVWEHFGMQRLKPLAQRLVTRVCTQRRFQHLPRTPVALRS